MTPRLALLALCLVLPAMAAEAPPVTGAEPAPAAETAPAAEAEPAAPASGPLAFAEALDACTAAQFEAPHPFMRGFTIQHKLIGPRDGSCQYTQSMPGDMTMECALSDEGKKALGDEFRAQAEGRMSGSTAKQPVWTSDCEIVAKDGKRTPLQGG